MALERHSKDPAKPQLNKEAGQRPSEIVRVKTNVQTKQGSDYLFLQRVIINLRLFEISEPPLAIYTFGNSKSTP